MAQEADQGQFFFVIAPKKTIYIVSSIRAKGWTKKEKNVALSPNGLYLDPFQRPLNQKKPTDKIVPKAKEAKKIPF